MEKEFQYAALIQSQIAEMFDEDCENHIDKTEFNDDENFKAFIHALTTLVPCNIFNKFTNGEEDSLTFNHVANHLVFEFSKKGA